MPFNTVHYYFFECDDCKQTAKFFSTQYAREKKWAISKNYKKCYCNKCAPNHRNVGRNGVSAVKPNKGEKK